VKWSPANPCAPVIQSSGLYPTACGPVGQLALVPLPGHSDPLCKRRPTRPQGEKAVSSSVASSPRAPPLRGRHLVPAPSARLTLALRLDPLDLRARNGLAEVHFRCRDYDEALRLWAESLRAYAKQPEVVERLQEIAQQRPDLAARIEWTIATYVTAKTTVPGMDLPGAPPPPAGVPEPGALHPTVPPTQGPSGPGADDPMVPLPRAPDPRATIPRP
jgi:hypothetical protein